MMDKTNHQAAAIKISDDVRSYLGVLCAAGAYDYTDGVYLTAFFGMACEVLIGLDIDNKNKAIDEMISRLESLKTTIN